MNASSKSPVVYLILMYSGMMGFFLSYRLCFIALFIDRLLWSEFLRLLSVGLQMDSVTTCCLLIPVLVVLILAVWLHRSFDILFKIAYCIFLTTFSFAFLVSWFNLFYYHSLHTTINHTIWSWIDNWQFIQEMILEDSVLSWSVWGTLPLLLIGSLHIKRVIGRTYFVLKASRQLLLLVVCLFFCIYSISRQSWGLQQAASFSSRVELNEAALNPCYILGSTTIAAYYFPEKFPTIDGTKITEKRVFVARDSLHTSPYNIVLIIMEGMQYSFTNDSVLTPFLFQLKKDALYFSNAYSSGLHTAHAIFSILTGLPAQCKHPFLNEKPITYQHSLPSLLKQKGYQTLFMMPHNDKFDNMKEFLMLNYFDRIYSQKDYPSCRIANVFGVNDDFLLTYSIPVIRESAKKMPTFCTILTVSNHIPFTIPAYFPDTGLARKYRIVQYADWALLQFFEKARKEDWFANTLFILVGDHAREGDGMSFYNTAAHHVALYFYAPGFIKTENRKQLAGQVDILPTALGYLNLPFSFDSYGIDLNNRQRDFLLTSSNNSIECIGNRLYYEYKNEGENSFIILKSDSLLRDKELNQREMSNMKDYLWEKIQND